MKKSFETKQLADSFSVCGQLRPEDVATVAKLGFKSVICNRPDGEEEGQATVAELETAFAEVGITLHRAFVSTGTTPPAAVVEQFGTLLSTVSGPVLAFCRSGTRSATLWAMVQSKSQRIGSILEVIDAAGFNVESVAARLETLDRVEVAPIGRASNHHQVVIVGGGAGGIATATSLLKRDASLDIAIIEPAGIHYYQPGFTLVGAGVFKPARASRTMFSVMPRNVSWIREAVSQFQTKDNTLQLASGKKVRYDVLVAAPGIKLNWSAIDGLAETLGQNNVTSNYDFQHASYTWQLVQKLKSGRAVFTQPPMPIKCAGAPQKAMYLSCSYWERAGFLADIDVQFHNAGDVLFGVPEYVPALESYVERYAAQLNFNETLVAVDGRAAKAWFDVGESQQKEVSFDFLHVSPPQSAPDFVRDSALVNEAGWIDVDQVTLQHVRLPNVFSLGDACSAPNAKTAAAVRKQAPVVAANVCSFLADKPLDAAYDGYGSCPLTVERGKVVLAEFGYGGVLQPTAPSWLLDGTQPTRLGWMLKADMLPTIYFQLMLKGREWLAAPLKRSGLASGEAGHTGLRVGRG